MVRKVIIGTPAYDGRVEVLYTNALIDTLRVIDNQKYEIHPIWICNDALLQRARNDIIKIAIENEVDDLIFVDSDMIWNPQWITKLLEYDVDVVGGTARKKTDTEEHYAVKIGKSLDRDERGLMNVDGLGTGFVRITKKALHAIWDNSEEYKNQGNKNRMMFDIGIIDGELYSEDTMFFTKLKNLGFDLWLDPEMCCPHIGTKVFVGNLVDYIEKYKNQI